MRESADAGSRIFYEAVNAVVGIFLIGLFALFDDQVDQREFAGLNGLVGTLEALFAAVSAAAAGRSSFAPSVQRLQAQSPSRSLLSTREIEVLDLIAHGYTNRQIASALSIGEATVKTHVRHLCDKLEVADRAATVAAGYQRGLL